MTMIPAPEAAHVAADGAAEKSPLALTSHAQNFEDIMLWRALSHVQGGRYVDVGAQRPDVDSVSRIFYEHGWRGIHVEPVPAYAEQLRRARPEESVLEVALAAEPGLQAFYEVAGTGLSTSQADIAAGHALAGFHTTERTVPTLTLDQVFEHAAGEIHWLKIDVEGAEESVLRGWEKSPKRPWIVLVESTLPLSRVESHQAWEPLVEAKGYRFAWFDGLNRFYISADHPELASAFTCGPNVFDGFELSGEGSSPFCAKLKRDLAYAGEQGQRAEAAERALESEQVKVAALVAELETVRADAAVVAERLAAERRHTEWLSGEASTAQGTVESLTAELGDSRARVVSLSALLEEANRALAQEAAAARERIEHLQTSQALQVDRFQAHADWLVSTMDARSKEVEQGRLEAHRWWVAAEQLRRELTVIHASRSWRLTAPLRGTRRALSQPVPVLKNAARAVLVWAMRQTVAAPALRGGAQRALDSMPRVRNRLRALAVHARVIPGEVVRPRPPVAVAAGLASRSDLTPGARRLHAQLERALRQKEGRCGS